MSGLEILARILEIYWFVLLARVIISWIPLFTQRPLDYSHPLLKFLIDVTEPILAPIRRFALVGMIDPLTADCADRSRHHQRPCGRCCPRRLRALSKPAPDLAGVDSGNGHRLVAAALTARQGERREGHPQLARQETQEGAVGLSLDGRRRDFDAEDLTVPAEDGVAAATRGEPDPDYCGGSHAGIVRPEWRSARGVACWPRRMRWCVSNWCSD